MVVRFGRPACVGLPAVTETAAHGDLCRAWFSKARKIIYTGPQIATAGSMVHTLSEMVVTLRVRAHCSTPASRASWVGRSSDARMSPCFFMRRPFRPSTFLPSHTAQPLTLDAGDTANAAAQDDDDKPEDIENAKEPIAKGKRKARKVSADSSDPTLNEATNKVESKREGEIESSEAIRRCRRF